jgi:hypothetical protein
MSSRFVAKRRRKHHTREKDKEVTIDCKFVPTIGANRQGVSCETSKATFQRIALWVLSAPDATGKVLQMQHAECTRRNTPSAPEATCQVHQMQHAKYTRCNIPSAPGAIWQVHQMKYAKCTRRNMPSALDAVCQVHQMKYAKPNGKFVSCLLC